MFENLQSMKSFSLRQGRADYIPNRLLNDDPFLEAGCELRLFKRGGGCSGDHRVRITVKSPAVLTEQNSDSGNVTGSGFILKIF